MQFCENILHLKKNKYSFVVKSTNDLRHIYVKTRKNACKYLFEVKM